ncbi:S-Ena type endospore appendage [Bacillus cereus]|uniref:Endospore appendages core domain-containing protein n=1 Tax=Bacillus cereus HuA2-1 TaxID=1053201 RepID=J9BSM1_BACCE|nr:hypothetical protein IG3_03463 [Bacillus cereus HuA2-1]
MCNSGCNTCCSPAQFFQEKICGNYVGTGTVVQVWSAPAGSYISGTFEIFNPTSNTALATGTVTPSGTITPSPGDSASISLNSPTTSFSINAAAGDTGTFCITLYKRIVA